MNPKEKASELVDKMYYFGRYDDKDDYNPAMAWERAIQCALIAVDEMLKEIPTEILNTYKNETNFIINERFIFWQEVKTEIEKL
jgi:hypothetical protein